MILPILYPYIKFSLGTLYPVYKTWKALKRKDETTRCPQTKQRRWMKYWVSFGLFQMVEFFSDITLIFILPFYYEIKLAIIMWLVHGTKLVYDSIINRELTKREKAIDKWLTRINKYRDEIIALVWFEMSRCSVRIIGALMSGGLSVLTKSQPDLEDSCNEISSPTISNSNNQNTVISNRNNNNSQSNNHHHEHDDEDSYITRHYQRRSKRHVKVEEIEEVDESDADKMIIDTEDTDDHNTTMDSQVTVQYAIAD